ncbi:AAA family ATPase [Corallococcus exiguus]|uniref:AAA family ATPase n=1 Tax=Corallococcus exiguus TaxID=83462 RepID=UPI001560DA3C|nr:ATP-binding protein [Corallococcus exiguus]NRD44237.1 ATP-binding protein [Corallococcus exiguus]
MKVLIGDTVVLKQQAGNPIGIVTRRNGNTLTVRLPWQDNTLERVSRSDVEPLAVGMADARKRQAKFSNSLSLAGQSSLAELVKAFGYATDVKMQRSSLGNVVRQLERAGLDVKPTTGSWDRYAPFVLGLKNALLDPSEIDEDEADEEEAPEPGLPSSFALPQPFWPSALGLSQEREVAFLRALTAAEPILALLYLPDSRSAADWLQATWEGLMGWAYRSAQRFIRTPSGGEPPSAEVVRGPPTLLHGYLRPSVLASEGSRLQDAPRTLNLVALRRDADAPVDQQRLLSTWPGPVFEFDATAISSEGTPVSRLLLMVGGKPEKATDAIVAELSPLKLVLWSREACAHGSAQAMNSWGETLKRAPFSRFKGGNESATALSLKARLAQWVGLRSPDAELEFEHRREEVLDEDGTTQEVTRTDLHVEELGSFEVETLLGSGPMEAFYHRKIFSRRKAGESFSLVVPSEALLWAGPFLADIAHHLGEDGAVLVPVAGTAFAKLEPRPLTESASEVKDPEEARRESTIEPVERDVDRLPGLADVAGYTAVKQRIQRDIIWPERRGALLRNVSRASGILFFGPPGCGKSLLARAIAGELEQEVRLLSPSDLRGPYVGWGNLMIREQFDWVVEQEKRMLVLDELDAVARSRRNGQMHSDEKADVNELLVQLDRAGRLRRIIVGTTNFLGALDEAVIRSGRFGRYVPVPPPDLDEAIEIVSYYLKRLGRGGQPVFVPSVAELNDILGPLFLGNRRSQRFFSGSDLEAAVTEAYLRCAQRDTPMDTLDPDEAPVRLTREELASALEGGPRSVSAHSIRRFLKETQRHCGAALAEILAQRFDAKE